jgi:formylglycine-generating enzyme required for sulfatase activity
MDVRARDGAWTRHRRITPTLIALGLLAACDGSHTRPDAGTDKGSADVYVPENATGPIPDAGPGVPGPSCEGLLATCGPQGDINCCTSLLVQGGTFRRGYSWDDNGGFDSESPATVSDFRLDKYEITVGRFRKFLEANSPDMIPAGAGKNPNDPNDEGWDPSSPIPDKAHLYAMVNCHTPWQTWTDTPGPNENKPVHCLEWNVALAFCAWDGGRLPTEAEWGYAAAGGQEQRQYPWSVPANSATIDCSHANTCGVGLNDVGSTSPLGDGKWGQADLIGNVFEWTRDQYGSYPVPCVNCTNRTALIDGPVFRGGDFSYAATSAWRGYNDGNSLPYGHYAFSVGARCARSP